MDISCRCASSRTHNLTIAPGTPLAEARHQKGVRTGTKRRANESTFYVILIASSCKQTKTDLLLATLPVLRARTTSSGSAEYAKDPTQDTRKREESILKLTNLCGGVVFGHVGGGGGGDGGGARDFRRRTTMVVVLETVVVVLRW